MTEENTPDSISSHPNLTPNLEDKKGQMLVIYLPEGSVIVDRSDIQLSSAPAAIVEQIAPRAEAIAPKTESVAAKAEPIAAKPETENAASQQLQPTLQEVVQLAVQEVLQITGHSANQAPKVEAPIAEVPRTVEKASDAFADYPAPALKSATPAPAASTSTAPAYKGARRVHVRRRRRINWVHGVNTILVAYLLLVAIVPAVLSSAFGVAVYASKVPHPGALIARGDLMVCKVLPASKLAVNDVLLVRDGNSWRLDARQVTSNTSNGGLSTITTASTGGVALDKTYVVASDSGSYLVSRVIPKLGYVAIVLSSFYAKVLGGLFILILNLTVHFRRSRKRRLETVIR